MYDGYTSEKLLTSLMAHTVPIYWGNKYVSEEFNSEAFINCNDYENFDDVVKRIREIDEDDDLWAYMVSQPWQTNEQKQASDKEYEHYMEFMTNIFTQPLPQAQRRPEGTWPAAWRKIFDKASKCPSTKLVPRILRNIIAPHRIPVKIFNRIRRKFLLRDYPGMRTTDINEFFRD